VFQKIREIIDRGQEFLITTHIDPDGDAIGSAFSLYWALDSMGKTPYVYLRDPVPYMYEFLPGPPRLIGHEIPDRPFDAIFVVDCGNLFRAGDGYQRLKGMGPLINIDHHATNEPFGVVNLINEDSSSTAEILHGLFEYLGVDPTYNMALNIYTAIFTDTGSFRYPNTSTSAFLICEKMIETGVSPSFVAQMVHENHPIERFHLLGMVLSSLQTFRDGLIVMAHVTQEMFSATGATKEQTEGFVEFIKEIRGLDVAVLIREINEQRYKISMRSKGDTDVAYICSLFGGGGHRKAAGCTIEGSIDEVKDKLKEALRIQ
jgi:bifunctional oligoribonuclease and PAP phosphatase NrnA